MAILLTGGTGKTSTRIARFLQDRKTPFLLASRKAEAAGPSGKSATNFDWLNSSTFEKPFQHKFPDGESISAAYLIAPQVPDPVPSINAFIYLAVKHGVKIFVMMTGSLVEKGGHNVGKVWSHLDDVGVEYTVLLATWLMENFSEQRHLHSIKNESKIYTACCNGKIPFVTAREIADVTFHALTENKPHDTMYRVLGPESLSHDEIAEKVSSSLGRNIFHIKLSEEQKLQCLLGSDRPEYLVKLLASLEVAAANGSESSLNNAVKSVTGRPPQNFDAWMQQIRSLWQ